MGGGNEADVCREFGLVNSTIQIFGETEPKLLVSFDQNGWKVKRFRKPGRSVFGKALFKWCKQERSDNVPASCPFL